MKQAFRRMPVFAVATMSVLYTTYKPPVNPLFKPRHGQSL